MTIAVIGHGRSPEGKSWGSRIDVCSTVVRCWDWHWQHPRDFGYQYHYGLFVLTPRNFRLFSEHNQRRPERGWLVYLGKPTSCHLPDSSQLVDTTRWCDLGRALGGQGLSGGFTLTRGCAMAAWAIEHAGKGEEVILVGFDNVLCGINKPIEESFCPEYWAMQSLYWDEKKTDKIYPVGEAKTATHDMSVEKPLLEALASSNNVPLKFAQEVWE